MVTLQETPAYLDASTACPRWTRLGQVWRTPADGTGMSLAEQSCMSSLGDVALGCIITAFCPSGALAGSEMAGPADV